MKKFLFFLTVLVVSICSVSAEVVTVKVDVPGTFGMVLLTKVDQLANVTELTVIGKLNDSDLDMFSGLKNATKIDVSQTDIKSIRNCKNLTKLEAIILPSTVTEVQSNAFDGCSLLKQASIPNAESIGAYAFRGCKSLEIVNLPKTTSIGQYAFSGCNSLESISLPSVTLIGQYAFSSCRILTSADLPVATGIGQYAFAYCSGLIAISFPAVTIIDGWAFVSCSSLTTLDLPKVEAIGTSAFSNCTSLTTVSMPKVKTVYQDAFTYCISLKTLELPSSLRKLAKSASLKNLADVYCYMTTPLTTDAFSDNGFNASNTTLHVPAFAVNAYQLNKRWNVFGRIVAIECNVDNVCVNSNLTLVDLDGIADQADLSLNYNSYTSEYGHLTVSAKEKWAIKDFVLSQPKLNDKEKTTLIPYSEMVSDNVTVKYCFKTRQWNFISFPFDVNVSDIECPEGTLWVVRKYSGEDRAKMTGNTWQNMTNGMILKAGEGYIIQCAGSGADSSNTNYIWFTFKAVDNGNKNNIFAVNDVWKPLSKFASNFSNNRSWNLVGNPYPCFFDTRFIEHNGVITVWNGSGYSAYSLSDDNYVLSPHEAFFVQCPDGASGMKFKAEGRQHSSEVASQSVSYGLSSAIVGRQVYNFTLSGAGYADRARVVINEFAQKDYEISCDASKFMSDNTTVPQLYAVEDNQRMSIDERPLSDGTIALGMYIGESGVYTIALSDATTDKVTLIDTATGNTANLNADAYTFMASKGVIDDRFIIQIGDAAGIKNVSADEPSAKSSIFSLEGQKLVSPQKGINVINGNKVLVR